MLVAAVQIRSLRLQHGDVIVSFGGANGDELAEASMLLQHQQGPVPLRGAGGAHTQCTQLAPNHACPHELLVRFH